MRCVGQTRDPNPVVAVLCGAISLLLVHTSTYSEDPPPMPSAPQIIVLLAVSFNACATSGWNSLDALTTDSFPQAVRATAFGVLSGSGRVASLIAQFVNGALSEQPHLMLAVTGGCMLLGCIGGMCVKGTARSMARAD